ncbi:hypothetical protein JCM8097_009026 [Rhodosporidiobolus ruineniae]
MWDRQDGKACGQWTLWLLNATEGDVSAVQRVLQFLPPTTASTLSPFPPTDVQQPHLRNSLILYDNASQSVVGFIPLSTGPSTRPTHPAPPSPPTSQLPSPGPSPAFHPPAAGFAQYINRVVDSIHPDPTSESLDRAAEQEAERRAKLAKEEEASDEVPIPLPSVDFPPSPGEEDLTRPASPRRDQQAVAANFARLDLEMELAREPKKPSSSSPSNIEAGSKPRYSRLEASTWTVSSFATFGTERFVTADEGGEENFEASRRSSFSPNADGAPGSTVPMSEKDDTSDDTPRPTLLAGFPAPSLPAATVSAAPASVPQLPTLPVFDPSHTFSNGNAVLLSFFNTPSAIFSSPSSPSTSARTVVAAHPLSEEQASEMTVHGEITPAVLGGDGDGGDKKSGEGSEGWWSWLSGLWAPVPPPQETTGSSSWLSLSSLLALFSSSSPSSPSSLPASPSSRRSRPRTARRAGGETKATLSVYHVDEEGWGRRAYFAA